MAGTHDITQTRACYVCQSVTSTGPGESQLNALETVAVRSIADGSLALIAPTGQVFRWDDTSLLPPGPPGNPTVVLPWGQSLIMLGRWLLVAPGPNPVDIYYNFLEALPLQSTLTPEYGALEAALQQSTLRVINGDISDHGLPPNGYTGLTLHNQQIFYRPLGGPTIPMVQRARLQFLSGTTNPGLEPVIVTDSPSTDSTLVTIYGSGGGGALPPTNISQSLGPLSLGDNTFVLATLSGLPICSILVFLTVQIQNPSANPTQVVGTLQFDGVDGNALTTNISANLPAGASSGTLTFSQSETVAAGNHTVGIKLNSSVAGSTSVALGFVLPVIS